MVFKTENTIGIQLVRLTEVCGKVFSEKNGYKSVKTALLLSNVIDADHQNSCPNKAYSKESLTRYAARPKPEFVAISTL